MGVAMRTHLPMSVPEKFFTRYAWALLARGHGHRHGHGAETGLTCCGVVGRERRMATRPRNAPPVASRRPLVLLALGALTGAGVAAAGLLSASARNGALPSGVVALVNREPIRTDDYLRTVQALANDKRDALTDDDRRRVLDRLIEEELLVQRGLALGLARQDRRVRSDLTSTVIDSVV